MLRFHEVRLGAGEEAACRRCASASEIEPVEPAAGSSAVLDIELTAANSAGALLTGTGSLDPGSLVEYAARLAALGVGRIGVRISGGNSTDSTPMRLLLESGVRVIEVVFLGSGPELHDALVGTPGGFDRAVGAIHACSEAAGELGVKVAVRGRIRLCAHNLHDAPAAVMRLAEMGVTSIVLECDPRLDVRRSAEWVAAACDTGTVNRVWVAVTGMPDGALGDKALHALDVISLTEGVA